MACGLGLLNVRGFDLCASHALAGHFRVDLNFGACHGHKVSQGHLDTVRENEGFAEQLMRLFSTTQPRSHTHAYMYRRGSPRPSVPSLASYLTLSMLPAWRVDKDEPSLSTF